MIEELPHKRRRTNDYGPLASEWRQRMLIQDPNIDTSFGLRFVEAGRIMMGSKYVTIDGDDLIVENEVYEGTKDLWTLITDNRKDLLSPAFMNNSGVSGLEYVKLLKQTNVLHHNFDPDNPHPRSSNSWKWNYILKPLWIKFKEGMDEDEDQTRHGHGLGSDKDLYVQKKGKCYRIQTVDGNGLYLTPYRRLRRNGIFFKNGDIFYKGEGLLLGLHSPFKHIPRWLL